MKIDFLIADNPYDTTPYFAEGFIAALQKGGADVRSLKITPATFVDVCKKIQERKPTLTLSFSDITDGGGNSLGNCLQIPHFTYMLDPAIYFLYHLQGSYSYVSCVDQGDVEFVKNLGFERVSFLPHAVDGRVKCYFESPSYDAVFFGTCIDYEALKLPPNLMEAANRVLTSDVSILQALIDLKTSDENLVPSFHLVDHYTRGKERVELVSAMPSVSIWGGGPWEKYASHASIYDPIEFNEAIDIMRQAKVVLNSSCRFKRGYHERIFYALLVGTPVITAENPLLKGFEGVLTYKPGEWESAPDLLEKEFSIEAGQARVIDEHTWDSRAKELLMKF